MEISSSHNVSVNSGISAPPQSSSAGEVEALYSPLDEALTELAKKGLEPENEKEREEVGMFYSQLHQLHMPHDVSIVGGLSATSIHKYIDDLTPDEYVDNSIIVEPPQNLLDITGKIATQIACNVMNGVDVHNSTHSLFHILKEFSWETKLSLALTTYILTFGDSGFNLCVHSKVSWDSLPDLVKKVYYIGVTSKNFEKLPRVLYMTSKDPYVKAARTYFILATYWVFRIIVTVSTSHITTMSTGDRNFDQSISSPWYEKLTLIESYLDNTRDRLWELLVKKTEEDSINEAYQKIKETFLKDYYSGNMELLNVLFTSNDDMPQLYDGFTNKRVHFSELEGIYVLLFISSLDISQKHHIFDIIYGELQQKIPYKVIWIPITKFWEEDNKDEKESMSQKFKNLRTFMPWYSFDHISMVNKATIKFITDDWNFDHEPIIVVLDPQGKVINKNVLPTMLIWGNKAFPFTSSKEETLLDQQSWRLELLFDSNLRIDSKIFDWIRDDKYIFVYGGESIEWIRKFRMIVRKVTHKVLLPMEMVYVAKSHIEEPLQQLCECILREELGHCLKDPLMTWYFWRRLEIMNDSMTYHMKFNVVFQEIQRLHNFNKSNTCWAILAKGSRILVNGHGQVVLSTLEDYPIWKDKALEQGFGVGFQSHYRKLYRKKFPCERVEFLTANLKLPETSEIMLCPCCRRQMQHCITLCCYHSE
ncbi:Protein SIEVE ELEMENT OCCLUSION B [Bienertia sinuspersici]